MATTQCLGRLVNDKHMGFFGNGKNKFHLELRCERNALPGTSLCGRCHERPRELGRFHMIVLHGMITEPIPPWSHIFGGEWFQAKVNTYGHPSEEEMAKGRKANLIATAATAAGAAEAPPLPVMTTTPSSPSVSQTKPRGRAKKQTTSKLQPVASTTSIATSMTDISVATSVASTGSLPVSVPTLAYESNELILDTYDIVKIDVRPFTHDGVSYFLDSQTQKVYSVGADTRPSICVGSWDSLTKTINCL